VRIAAYDSGSLSGESLTRKVAAFAVEIGPTSSVESPAVMQPEENQSDYNKRMNQFRKEYKLILRDEYKSSGDKDWKKQWNAAWQANWEQAWEQHEEQRLAGH
jgi:hypothetical protein